MEKCIKIGVSNRHVHLSKEIYELLYDDDFKIIKNLSQPNEYVTNKTVTLKNDNFEIKNVKVLGPLRNYSQVEISRSDAIKFKINPPVRESGNLTFAEKLILKTDKNEIELNCVIISQRHIHISKEEAKLFNLQNGQIVNVSIGKEKKGIIECFIKIKDNASLELHIDTDDAAAFIINEGDEGKLLL